MSETDDLTSRCSEFDKIDTGLLSLVGLIGGYAFLIPSVSVITPLSPYNEKRVLQIAVLLAAGIIPLVSRSVRRRWISVFRGLPIVSRWGLGLVFGLGFLSSALAPAPFYAFLEVSHFTLLLVAAGGVAASVRCAPKLSEQVFLGVIVGGVALYVAYFTVAYGMHLAIAGIKIWPDGATNFGNIRFFNHYQTWTLPLLAGAFLAVPKKWRVLRGGVFTIFALWWALVLASEVRGTILGTFVAALGVAFLFHRRASRWLLVQVTALLAGVALYYLLFSTGEPPAATERFQQIGKSGSRRLQLWQVSLEMLWANLWLGAGPMHFAWPPYQLTGLASPHSALMQWLAEWGLPSTLMMIGLTTWGGWCYIAQEQVRPAQREAPNVIGISLVASLLAAAAHSMVSGIIVAPLSQMCLVLVGVWAWGRYKHGDSGLIPEALSVRAQTVFCVMLVASVGGVGAGLHDLTTVEERREAFVEATDRTRLSPRYWTQGYLKLGDPSVMEQITEED